MRVPYTNFKTREGDTDEVGGCTFIGGSWKEVDTAEIFDNKRLLYSHCQEHLLPLVLVNKYQVMRQSTTNSKN